MNKFVDAETAARMVRDADTVTVSGDLSLLVPEKILEALEERFLQTGEPRGLTLFTPVIVGSVAGRGMDRLSHSGMVSRVLSSSYSVVGIARMNALIEAGEVEAYALPMGTAYHLLRAIAARQPGVFTDVGLETFVDPRLGGGLIGPTGSAAPVEVVQLKEQEYLFYPAFPVDVAIIRGTTADEDGNLSLEDEPVSLGVAVMALAAKRSGGRVIAQVKHVTQRGALRPRLVEVPGSLVDAVVVDPDQAQRIGPDDPSLTGAARLPLELVEPLPLTLRKIIARRAALELRPRDLLNIGYGVAVGLPRIVLEEGIAEAVTFTTEHGALGGFPIDAANFGAHLNPFAIFDSPTMFDLYNGGGLDVAFLSHAQVDRHGNVNVSRFGNLLPGCGGFHNITEHTPRLVFTGSFMAKGLEATVAEGQLQISKEGRARKFVQEVEQITLSGRRAWGKGQSVRYVTERAVFSLGEDGPVLIEIAPGISVDNHVRPHVGFPLAVAPDLRLMDSRIFADGPMGLGASFGPAVPAEDSEQ